jgi:hypothetical protein
MLLQDYTPVRIVLETLNYTTFRLESNLTFNREFEHLLGNSGKISACISQKAININTLILQRGTDY